MLRDGGAARRARRETVAAEYDGGDDAGDDAPATHGHAQRRIVVLAEVSTWMTWLVVSPAGRAEALHGVPAAGPVEPTTHELL